jgi:hypothetical protein
MTCKFFLNVMSAVAAIISAGLWFYAAYVKVPVPKDDVGGAEFSNARIVIGGDTDYFTTAAEQLRWNKWAAFAAGVAAACQAITTLL